VKAESAREGRSGEQTGGGKSLDPKLTRHADVPGLTREQFALVHNWLADGHSIPAARLGFVALVETPNGDYRRRAYLTLESAHRAMQRAAARGVDSRIVLVELRPVVQ
jgi:hypothetical protein